MKVLGNKPQERGGGATKCITKIENNKTLRKILLNASKDIIVSSNSADCQGKQIFQPYLDFFFGKTSQNTLRVRT